MIFPTTAGTNTYTFTDAVTLDKNTSIIYGSARNQANQNAKFKTLSFRNSSDQEIFAVYYQYEGIALEKTNDSMIWGALPTSGWADIKIDIIPNDEKLAITLTVTNTKNSTEETRTKEISATTLNDLNITAIKLISDSGVTSGRDIGISEIKIEQVKQKNI